MRDEPQIFDPAYLARQRQGIRERAASRQRAAASVITRSIVPKTFDLGRAASEPSLQATIRADAACLRAAELYAKTREAWWPAVSHGSRSAIDRTAWELTSSYVACFMAVFDVMNRSTITAMKQATDEALRHRQSLEARIIQLKDERDRALDEARQSRQIPAPIQVELTLPSVLPDVNVNLKPSAGVELEYDSHGKVIGTRPRGTNPVTAAIKKTQAGQSIVA